MIVFWYCGKRHRRQNDDDRDDDHQFEQGKTRLQAPDRSRQDVFAGSCFLPTAVCLLSLPVTVLLSIQCGAFGSRTHVKDIFAAAAAATCIGRIV